MIRSGARRVLVIVAVLAAAATALAVVLGLAGGFGTARSLALGFYIVGTAAGFVGFILGTSRLLSSKVAGGSGRAVEESRDSRALAALLMVIGVGFVFVGVACDPGATAV